MTSQNTRKANGNKRARSLAGPARAKVTEREFRRQMEGVWYDLSARLRDEAPGAYKDIQTVMDNQSDLVEIVAELRQVVCVKG